MSDKILKGYGLTGSEEVADRLDFSVAGPSLVKEEVLRASYEAREIVRRARDEARLIAEQAAQTLARAERERETERQRGYEVGRQAGHQEVIEKLCALENRYEEVFERSEDDIVQMVMDIAEKVIGSELKKGAIVSVVKKTIGQAVGQKLVIHVSPADLLPLKKKEKELIKLLDVRQGIVLKEDETITAGGCLIETELGTIDARLEVQLEAIRKGLGL